MKISREEILTYHLGGKIGVQYLKSLKTQRDLSIAYTPGVAQACNTIKDDPDKVYQYTLKSNLVAVVTDGTAVLGLGDIGALASIPVMEGKAVLFKAFADVDAWPVPLEFVRANGNVGKTDPAKVIDAVAALSPMYGGINLEDIAAPACFEIEKKLDEMLTIPVFHDDQWGTAVIVLAAAENYCLISKKNLAELSIAINGAGAAGIRIAEMLKTAGATQVVMTDSKGVLHAGRNDLNEYKKIHAVQTSKRTLAEAIKNADVFIGVSAKNCVTPQMVLSMNHFPAIFAMANPDPEIAPKLVKEALGNKPYIMATGRSDYPNQINNVLGFPHLFRGALDVRSHTISMKMKQAASSALATVARDGVVDEKTKAYYGRNDFSFGTSYLVPLPMDPRVSIFESSAVAQAALDEGNSAYCQKVKKEEVLAPSSDTDLINGTLENLLFSEGKFYARLNLNGHQKAIPIGRKIEIEDLSQKNSPPLISIDPKKEPGKFFRFASQYIGFKKIGQKDTPSVGTEGTLVCLSKKSGWVLE